MNLFWAILITIAAVTIAVGTMLLVRRRAPEGSFFTDGDRASGVFGVLATGFAIFAGFVIYLAFTVYDNSRSGAETEALTVVQQFETAQFLPNATRRRLGSDLVCYARYVVGQEWPRMENGTDVDALNPWGIRMFRALKTTDARTNAEQSAYGKWLDQTSDREQARQARLHGAVGIIPNSIWVVLVLSAGLIFVYMLFFADSGEYARSQAMLIGSATAIVTVTLLVILALDNPYRPGLGSLKPTAMQRSLVLLDEARGAIGDRGSVPCDARGEPSES